MAATAILKIAFFGRNSSTDCPISAKFCEEAESHADKGHMKKVQICKIQDGGWPPFWKSLYRHISVKNLPILMKFDIQHQISNRLRSRNEKLKFLKFEMAMVAILKIAFLAIIH